MNSTSFQRWLEPRLLKAYGSKTDKDSPLDIPRLLVTKTFLVALIAGILLTNIAMHTLWRLSEWQLGDVTLPLNAQKQSDGDENKLLTIRAQKLLPPELHNKARFEDGGKLSDEVKALLGDDVITLTDALTYLDSTRFTYEGQSASAGQDIIGRLNYGYLLVAPLFDYNPPSTVLGRKKFDRPNFRSIPRLVDEDLDYALGMGLVTRFREEITEKYYYPRRLMQALGGMIQFITFVIALWGLLLIFLRWHWTKLQRRVLEHGKLLADANRADGIWDMLTTRASDTPLFIAYSNNTGDSLLTVRLIREMVSAKVLDMGASGKSYVEDRIDLMEARVQKSEYLLLDYINYAVPNLGFIGTILGIILSMTSVVAILESSGVLDMVEAFDKVGGALGLAFDTTFVSLVWVLVLSLLLARLQKREAELFDELREKGVLFATSNSSAA